MAPARSLCRTLPVLAIRGTVTFCSPSVAVLSNTVATSHMWLFHFKLVKKT